MKRILLFALATVWLAAGCRSVESVPDVAEEVDVVNETSLIPGQMIVELSDELVNSIEADLAAGAFLQTRSADVNSVFAGIGATKVERLYPDAGEWEPRHREAGLHKWYRIYFDPATPQTKAVRTVDTIDGVVFSEPAACQAH